MSVEFKDYYQILGVARDASADEIKKAFRKLARKHHPDVAEDKQAAEAKFKEINEAHEVLSDPEKRRKYDELGADWQSGGRGQPPPGWQPGNGGAPEEEFNFGGTGFSDFFERYFSGASRYGFPEEAYGGGAGYGGGTRRGSDVEGDILVTLEEAMHGAVRPLSLQIMDRRTGRTETRSFQVRIPVGILDGKRIRVPGQGESGSNGAEAGDLYLRVRFAAHPDFSTEGADVYHDLEVAPWEAVLGADVVVPTLDGSVKLRIQPGTENGRNLRVRGRGLPKGKSGERGDFHAVIVVQLPARLTDAERALWENLRAGSHFNPRQNPKS